MRPTFIVNAFVFLATFCVAAAGITTLLPPRDIFRDRCSRPLDEANVLLLGSSHVEINLNSKLLESELSKYGVDVRVENLALFGSGEWEQDYLFDLIADRADRVRLVVFDIGTWDPSVARRGILNPRSAQWHDIKRMAGLTLYILLARRDLISTLPEHLFATVMHYVPIGRWREQPYSTDPNVALATTARYPALPRRLKRWRTPPFLTFDEMLKHKAINDSSLRVQPYESERVREKVTKIAQRGWIPVVLLPPAPEAPNKAVAETVKLQCPGTIVISHDDPSDNRDLYDPAFRFDYSHLNALGIQIYSESVAAQIARILLNQGDSRAS